MLTAAVRKYLYEAYNRFYTMTEHEERRLANMKPKSKVESGVIAREVHVRTHVRPYIYMLFRYKMLFCDTRWHRKRIVMMHLIVSTTPGDFKKHRIAYTQFRYMDYSIKVDKGTVLLECVKHLMLIDSILLYRLPGGVTAAHLALDE